MEDAVPEIESRRNSDHRDAQHVPSGGSLRAEQGSIEPPGASFTHSDWRGSEQPDRQEEKEEEGGGFPFPNRRQREKSTWTEWTP